MNNSPFIYILLSIRTLLSSEKLTGSQNISHIHFQLTFLLSLSFFFQL